MYFQDILTGVSVKDRIFQALRQGRQSHAVLYQGPEGCAALPMALSAMDYIHCLHPGDRGACGSCRGCYLTKKYMHPDVYFAFPTFSSPRTEVEESTQRAKDLPLWRSFLETNVYGTPAHWQAHLSAHYKQAEQKKLNISREQGRKITHFASYMPYQSRGKTLLIWGVEYMHVFCVNALLKLLESPPKGTYFVLVSYDTSALLPTLLSRVQRYGISLPTSEQLATYLAKETKKSKEEAWYYAQMSGQQIAMARDWMEGGVSYSELITNWLRFCWRGSHTDILLVAEEVHKMKRVVRQRFFLALMRFLRESLLRKSGAEDLCGFRGEDKEFVERFIRPISFESLYYLIENVDSMLFQSEAYAHMKMLFIVHSLRISARLAEDKKAWQGK